MHLTLHADFSLRVLLYLAARPGKPTSTQEMADAYGISKHHLVRVVQTLAGQGFVEVRPGRSGGVLLAREPKDIGVGKVLRAAEPDFKLVECFDRETNACPIAPACGLIGTDDRDVVFRLAADDAGVAPDAGIEVDRHAPGMTLVRPFRIK